MEGEFKHQLGLFKMVVSKLYGRLEWIEFGQPTIQFLVIFNSFLYHFFKYDIIDTTKKTDSATSFKNLFYQCSLIYIIFQNSFDEISLPKNITYLMYKIIIRLFKKNSLHRQVPTYLPMWLEITKKCSTIETLFIVRRYLSINKYFWPANVVIRTIVAQSQFDHSAARALNFICDSAKAARYQCYQIAIRC